ncbi:MAG: S1C family serine protease [Alphaproteobacteria bacterium]
MIRLPVAPRAAFKPSPMPLRGGLFAAVLLAVLLPVLAGFPRPATAGPLEAVVGVRAVIPADARTAPVLGTARAGSGAVIGVGGLVLTIGYLILEAIEVDILLPGGRVVPAEVVAYDYETGFGLLRALGTLGIEPVALGGSATLTKDTKVLVAGFDGPGAVAGAQVVSRRDFAGYWEYLLPEAIFTAPPHHAFGGAALLGPDGKLLGIGSLAVGDAAEPNQFSPGNMFVPIDALKPILDDMIALGRSRRPPRPWLGLYSEDLNGRVFVNRVASYGPAAKAGITANTVIVAVKGAPVHDLADFYSKLWALGPAGVDVPLTLMTAEGTQETTVRSADRYDFLKIEPSY